MEISAAAELPRLAPSPIDPSNDSVTRSLAVHEDGAKAPGHGHGPRAGRRRPRRGAAHWTSGRRVVSIPPRMVWTQVELSLESRPRGVHLVTDEVVAALPQLARVEVGLLHLFLQHTSASLSVNENADRDVRRDVERWLDRAVPENSPDFVHVAEGPDDMPAHLKSLLLGVALVVPIRAGRLALGTWQGIYLGEHRDAGGRRKIIATILGP